MPTVSSPQFEVKARFRSSEIRTPATAVRFLIEDTYFCREQSITSTAGVPCARVNRRVVEAVGPCVSRS